MQATLALPSNTTWGTLHQPASSFGGICESARVTVGMRDPSVRTQTCVEGVSRVSIFFAKKKSFEAQRC